MRSMVFLPAAVFTIVVVLASTFSMFAGGDQDASPSFGITIPPGYRDWKLISVAHEAGNLNDSAPFSATI